MRFLFLLIFLINTSWCMDAEDSSFAASRKPLKAKHLSRYLKPPLNTTWDESKVTEFGIPMDDDLKQALIQWYEAESSHSSPSVHEKPIPVDILSLAKTKKRKVLDSESKTDSECTSASLEDSAVIPTSQQEAIKTGMEVVLPWLKARHYPIRVELAFCLKGIYEADKAKNDKERGGCLRLAKAFNKLAEKLKAKSATEQQKYLRSLAKLNIQQQIQMSGEYTSQEGRLGRLKEIVSDHVKRLAEDLSFSHRETYLKELMGENL